MKRSLILILVALTALSCGPARIIMDTRMDDGDRVILTSDKHLFNDIDVALGAKIAPKDTVLAILATYNGRSDHGVFNKDGKMLIRLTDGSVITLVNLYDKEYEKETSTNVVNDRVTGYGYSYEYDPFSGGVYVAPYEVSAFVPRVETRTTTKSYALYLITKSQLSDIIGKGAIKVRFELDTKELDMVSGTEALSAIFAEQYNCLKDWYGYDHNRSSF